MVEIPMERMASEKYKENDLGQVAKKVRRKEK